MSKKSYSQTGTQYRFDVVVIGSGIAGLNYCLSLLQHTPQCKIALITKKDLTESNTYYAQGGIAAVTSADDSIEHHLKDTLIAGDGLCKTNIAKQIIQEGEQAIAQLLKYGVPFQQTQLGQEGGHSHRRVHHVGDYTGAAIMQALVQQIKQHKKIKIFDYHTAINLMSKRRKNKKEVMGVYVLDEPHKKIHTFIANAIILASGGAGKVYRYTSNPDIATGDGIAMAYRAGARLTNLEFYQFHPTLLHHAEKHNFLITEALRGEGAYLRNAETGERFMQRYAPKQMELATRDVVARAIFNEIEQSTQDFVYLDVRHKSQQFLKQRFPTIFNTLAELNIHMHRDMIPVVPAAHYCCGGIVTNINGQTNIARLYAIGETACTGLHGANRLASNSLLEGMVMSSRAATDSMRWIQQPIKLEQPIKDWNSKSVINLRRATQISAQWVGLRAEMTSYAGIVRTRAGLKDLLALVRMRRNIIEKYYWEHIVTRDIIELRNIVLIAELITQAALKRRKSCGGHYREDMKHS